MTIEAYYWKDKIDNQILKTRKKREQELSLTLDPTSQRPPSTKEVIYLDFNRKRRGGQR